MLLLSTDGALVAFGGVFLGLGPLTSLLALEVGAERRREVATDSMRAARASEERLRHAAGLAMVALGQRVAGEPQGAAATLKVQTGGDCL